MAEPIHDPASSSPPAALSGGRAAAGDAAAPAQAPRLSARLRDNEGWLGRVWRLLAFAARRADEERITQVASSLTFTSVLSMVPLLAVALALFTAFPLFREFQGALENYLATNLMPASVADNIMGYLNQFAQKATRLTAIGGLFLMVTAVSLMLTIDKALNDIWHVRRPRALAQRVLIYWATLTLGPVLMGASLWATTVLARESLGLAAGMSVPLEFLLSFLPMVVTGLAFAALFIVVPNRFVEPRDALIGGFVAAVVQEVMKAGFAYYLTRFPTYTVLYGAFATLPIFLMWIYLSWLVTLFGAILAASLPQIRAGRLEARHRPGQAFVDALAILRALEAARGDRPPGIATRVLRERMTLPYDQLMTVLEALEDIGYVARVGDAGSARERWALVCDPQQAPVGPVVDRLLLDRRHFDDEGMGEPLRIAAGASWDGASTLAEAFAVGEAADAAAAQDSR